MNLLLRHCILVAAALATGLGVACVGPAIAQNLYGTNSSGQTCIANLTDCYAPNPSVPSGRGRQETRVYAAVAIADPDDVIAYGFGSGFESRAQAEAAALRGCEDEAAKNNPAYRKKKACSIKLWFYNHCGAVAITQRGGFGTYQHASLNVAERGAMRKCQEANKEKCTFLRRWCVSP